MTGQGASGVPRAAPGRLRDEHASGLVSCKGWRIQDYESLVACSGVEMQRHPWLLNTWPCAWMEPLPAFRRGAQELWLQSEGALCECGVVKQEEGMMTFIKLLAPKATFEKERRAVEMFEDGAKRGQDTDRLVHLP